MIVGVDKEAQMLKDDLRIAQAMLNNTEERQVSDIAVKLWFDQLKDVYYMMDDVLDTWNTARTKSQIQKEEKKLINLVLRRRYALSDLPYHFVSDMLKTMLCVMKLVTRLKR